MADEAVPAVWAVGEVATEGESARAARLQGRVMGWASRANKLTPEQRRLRRIAQRVTSSEHLEALLQRLQPEERAAYRDALKPFLRFEYKKPVRLFDARGRLVRSTP